MGPFLAFPNTFCKARAPPLWNQFQIDQRMTDTHLSDLDFESLQLAEPIKQGIRELGFRLATPIQAQTGTGKTAAFLVALFQNLLTRPSPPSREPTAVRALVIAPTRELAVQIHSDAEALGRHTGLKLAVVFGGTDYDKQRTQLQGGIDVLIGTPGRLIDYYKQHVYDLKHAQVPVSYTHLTLPTNREV